MLGWGRGGKAWRIGEEDCAAIKQREIVPLFHIIKLRPTPAWLSWRRRRERLTQGDEGVDKRGVVVVVRAKRPTAPPRTMRRSCFLFKAFEPLSLEVLGMVLLLQTKCWTVEDGVSLCAVE